MSTRFDTTPLRRAPRHGWRHFRTAAIAGEYGEDLAVPQWWRRWTHGVLTTLIAAAAVCPTVLVFTLSDVERPLLVMAVVFGVGFGAVVALLLGPMRFDSWGPRARLRYRLVAFARANGLDYRVDPGLERLGAEIFGYGSDRRHVDHFTVPGPDGFTVSNYTCDPAPDDPETGADHWGYAMFALRESVPHGFAERGTWRLTRSRDLEEAVAVEPAPGWRLRSTDPDHPLSRRLLDSGIVDRVAAGRRPRAIELVGDRLFLLYGGRLNLADRALWRQLAEVAETLSPFLSTRTEPSDTVVAD